MDDIANFFALNIHDINGLLFETATEGLLVVDKDGIICMSNPRISELFGYEKEELIGHSVEKLVPTRSRNAHKSERDKYNVTPRRRPMAEQSNLFGLKKDGTEIPLEISLNHFEVEGQFLVMALITDVTEKREMIEELRREKEVAQLYLDLAGSVIVVMDRNQNVQLVNRYGYNLLGYRENEIRNKNWIELVVPQSHRADNLIHFEKLISGENDIIQFESPVKTHTGKERIIDWTAQVIKNQSGSVVGCICAGVDITDQKLAASKLQKLNLELERRVDERTKALNESQQIYKLIARNFPNGVINVIDSNYNYVFVEGSELYQNGIEGSALIGTSFLDGKESETQACFKKKLARAFTGDNVSFEYHSGAHTYLVNAVGLEKRRGLSDQVLIVSQNITDQKNAETRIQESLEKEKRLNELKSRFIAMASHEFRTPLTTVMNASALVSKYIGRPNSEAKQRNHLERINSSIRQLNNILNDFLSLDRLEEGQVDFQDDLIYIPGLVQNAVEDVKSIVKAGQEIIIQHAGEEYILAPEHIVINILNNLLSNALKYSPEDSTVRLETKVSKDILTLHIEDSGMGIPQDEQHHVFDRFFRRQDVFFSSMLNCYLLAGFHD